MTKIYIGNLPYSATEDEISQLFASFQTVENVKIVKDRETKRSKGFAFVEMSSRDDMLSAIGDLNGKEFKGRILKVSEATGPRATQQTPTFAHAQRRGPATSGGPTPRPFPRKTEGNSYQR